MMPWHGGVCLLVPVHGRQRQEGEELTVLSYIRMLEASVGYMRSVSKIIIVIKKSVSVPLKVCHVASELALPRTALGTVRHGL